MSKEASGKFHREGMALIELFRMFPDDAAAEQWPDEPVYPSTRNAGQFSTRCSPKHLDRYVREFAVRHNLGNGRH